MPLNVPADRVRDRRNLAILLVLWFVTILLVDPRGNFPITDDWSYAGPVRGVVERGAFRYSDWSAPNLITHFAWGAAFASVLGTSYTALRVSTLVAAFLGGVALYKLLRLNQARPATAMLGTGLFLFDPLALPWSFSFMSDIGFTAAQTGAMYFVAAGTLAGSRTRRAAGWGLGVMALLCRQIGLAIPVGAAAGHLAGTDRASRASILRAVAPILLFLIVQIVFQWGLRASGKAPAQFGRQANGIVGYFLADPLHFVRAAGQVTQAAFFYFGLLLLPVSLLLLPMLAAALGRVWQRRVLAVAGLAIVLITARTLLAAKRFPTWGDTIGRDRMTPDLPGVAAPDWFLVPVTILAAVGGVLLLAVLAIACVRAWRDRRGDRRFSITAFAAATAVLQLLIIMVVEIRMDRYFVPVMPGVIVVVVALLKDRAPSRALFRAGSAAAIGMGVFTISGVHDMMAAKRVQIAAYDALAARVPATHIDGGWVLNGPVSFGRFGSRTSFIGWYERRDYIVTTKAGPEPKYRTIGVHPVSRWLPWNRDAAPVLVEQRVR